MNESGVDEYYEFLVLPQAGDIYCPLHLVSRFTLAITSYLRRTLTMVLFITYLDDLGWVICPWCPPLERARITNFIRDTFLNAGWMLSATKCIFDSNVTSLVLLGFTINTVPVLTVDMSPERNEDEIIGPVVHCHTGHPLNPPFQVDDRRGTTVSRTVFRAHYNHVPPVCVF